LVSVGQEPVGVVHELEVEVHLGEAFHEECPVLEDLEVEVFWAFG